MFINSVIIENLDENGLLKTIRVEATGGSNLVIAFPDEYEEDTDEPFHFLDAKDLLYQKRANCTARRLGKRKFFIEDDCYNFRTEWVEIPTVSGGLSYYALTLPHNGYILDLSITDYYYSQRSFQYRIYKDMKKRRYVIYLELRSKYGNFNFKLHCKFKINRELSE